MKLHQHYHNFIWDFDGTLFDTYPVMMQALKAAMTKHKITFDGDLDFFVKHKSIRELADLYGNQAFVDDYHELEGQMQENPAVYADIPELLQTITAAGGQHFILSHRDARTSDYLGERKGLFTAIITSQDNFPRKPDPAAIDYLLKTYQLDPERTLMIGDRPLDVWAGKNAGVKTLLLDEKHYFSETLADYKIETWRQWHDLDA